MDRQYGKDQWIAAVESWQTSGCTKKGYCTEHELSYSSFCYWARKLHPDSSRKGSTDILRAIEVPPDSVRGALFTGWPSTMADLDTQGIILGLAETNATVTITGRVSLSRLARIMAACETIDHARS